MEKINELYDLYKTGIITYEEFEMKIKTYGYDLTDKKLKDNYPNLKNNTYYKISSNKNKFQKNAILVLLSILIIIAFVSFLFKKLQTSNQANSALTIDSTNSVLKVDTLSYATISANVIEDNDATEFLKDFYTKWMSDDHLHFNDNFKQKYLSDKLNLNFKICYASAEGDIGMLDYDAFLNSQDPPSFKDILIKKTDQKIYKISSKSKAFDDVMLEVIPDGNSSFKIDKIINCEPLSLANSLQNDYNSYKMGDISLEQFNKKIKQFAKLNYLDYQILGEVFSKYERKSDSKLQVVDSTSVITY